MQRILWLCWTKLVLGDISGEIDGESFGPLHAPTYSRLMGKCETTFNTNATAIVVDSGVDLCNPDVVNLFDWVDVIPVVTHVKSLDCYEETILKHSENAGAIAFIVSSKDVPGTALNAWNLGYAVNEANIPLLNTGEAFHSLVSKRTNNSELHIQIDGCEIDKDLERCINTVLASTIALVGVIFSMIGFYSIKIGRSISKSPKTVVRRNILFITGVISIFTGICCISGLGFGFVYFWPTGRIYTAVQMIVSNVNICLLLQVPLCSACYWIYLANELGVLSDERHWFYRYFKGSHMTFKRKSIFCCTVFIFECFVLLKISLQPQVNDRIWAFAVLSFEVFNIFVLILAQKIFNNSISRFTLDLRSLVLSSVRKRMGVFMKQSRDKSPYFSSNRNQVGEIGAITAAKLVHYVGCWMQIYIVFGLAPILGTVAIVFDVSVITPSTVTMCTFTYPLIISFCAKAMMTFAMVQALKGARKAKHKPSRQILATKQINAES